MSPNAKELFEWTYRRYQETGDRVVNLSFGNDRNEKRQFINAVDELTERGLVTIDSHALGFIQFRLTTAGMDYFDAPQQPVQAAAQNINIGSIAGSAIVGNQANATINFGASIADIAALVAALPLEDKPAGGDLVEELRKLESGEKPLQKNALAKFSDLLAKHGSLASAVVALIGKLVVGA